MWQVQVRVKWALLLFPDHGETPQLSHLDLIPATATHAQKLLNDQPLLLGPPSVIETAFEGVEVQADHSDQTTRDLRARPRRMVTTPSQVLSSPKLWIPAAGVQARLPGWKVPSIAQNYHVNPPCPQHSSPTGLETVNHAGASIWVAPTISKRLLLLVSCALPHQDFSKSLAFLVHPFPRAQIRKTHLSLLWDSL